MRILAAVVAVPLLVGLAAPAQAAPKVQFRSASAVDGDTVRTPKGDVRVLGYDTPEIGQCGYEAAKRLAASLVRGGVTLHGVDGRDRYGRILAHVRLADGRDLGTVILRRGLAVARYDSRDGYDWHRYESRYHRIDKNTKNVCGFNPTKPAAKPTGSVYYPNCTAARTAGAAPVRLGDPGYGRHLDRDGDGVACE